MGVRELVGIGEFPSITYSKKRKHYLKQNILAQTLHEDAYENHPGLKRFLKNSRLKFDAHPDFKKADLEKRSVLYLKLAETIWNPARLHEEAKS